MPSTLFTTWAEYDAAVAQTIAAATHELLIFDHDLVACALEKPERNAQLVSFLRGSPRARLQIVVQDTQRVQTAMPRTLKLIATFGHAMSITGASERLASLNDSMVLADNRFGTIRFHRDHARGKFIDDDQEAIAPYGKRFQEIVAEGGHPLPQSILGL